MLELGPGPANLARLVQRRDLRWLGLESDLSCLQPMSRQLSGGALVDLEVLPRLPGGWTAVLAADILEHLNDPSRMLRLIRDALPPGGRLLISVPNVAHLYVRLALLFGRFPYADRGILDRTHRYFYTRLSLREALRRSGFEIVEEEVSAVPLPLALPWLPGFLLTPASLVLHALTRLAPTLLGYQLLAVARRPEQEGTRAGAREAHHG